MPYRPISAVGAVIVNDQITVVVRRGDMLEEPLQFLIRTLLEAAVILLKQRGPDGGVIYIESGGQAAQVLEEIRTHYSKSPDEIVNGMAQPRGYADDSVQFANRRSELFYNFRKRIEAGKLLVPSVYNEQLSAFEQSEQSGKIFFPSPDLIAGKLGRYPAYAVAAVLAAIEPARSGAVKMKSNSGIGHDPYATVKT